MRALVPGVLEKLTDGLAQRDASLRVGLEFDERRSVGVLYHNVDVVFFED